jgi:ATP-dependent Clp protease adaptor protein ClpS
MSDLVTIPKVKPRTRTERPKLWKVILLNDDFTPRDFVVKVLKAVFRMTEGEAYGVMLTAHRRGACVVAVFHEGSGRDEGDQGHRHGPPGGLSARLHDRREE